MTETGLSHVIYEALCAAVGAANCASLVVPFQGKVDFGARVFKFHRRFEPLVLAVCEHVLPQLAAIYLAETGRERQPIRITVGHEYSDPQETLTMRCLWEAEEERSADDADGI